jgi:hypothetical protein
VTSAKKNPLEHMIELVNYFPTVILTVKTLFLNMKVVKYEGWGQQEVFT